MLRELNPIYLLCECFRLKEDVFLPPVPDADQEIGTRPDGGQLLSILTKGARTIGSLCSLTEDSVKFVVRVAVHKYIGEGALLGNCVEFASGVNAY